MELEQSLSRDAHRGYDNALVALVANASDATERGACRRPKKLRSSATKMRHLQLFYDEQRELRLARQIERVHVRISIAIASADCSEIST